MARNWKDDLKDSLGIGSSLNFKIIKGYLESKKMIRNINWFLEVVERDLLKTNFTFKDGIHVGGEKRSVGLIMHNSYAGLKSGVNPFIRGGEETVIEIPFHYYDKLADVDIKKIIDNFAKNHNSYRDVLFVFASKQDDDSYRIGWMMVSFFEDIY